MEYCQSISPEEAGVPDHLTWDRHLCDECSKDPNGELCKVCQVVVGSTIVSHSKLFPSPRRRWSICRLLLNCVLLPLIIPFYLLRFILRLAYWIISLASRIAFKIFVFYVKITLFLVTVGVVLLLAVYLFWYLNEAAKIERIRPNVLVSIEDEKATEDVMKCLARVVGKDIELILDIDDTSESISQSIQSIFMFISDSNSKEKFDEFLNPFIRKYANVEKFTVIALDPSESNWMGKGFGEYEGKKGVKINVLQAFNFRECELDSDTRMKIFEAV